MGAIGSRNKTSPVPGISNCIAQSEWLRKLERNILISLFKAVNTNVFNYTFTHFIRPAISDLCIFGLVLASQEFLFPTISFNPQLAVSKDFFLPDRHRSF